MINISYKILKISIYFDINLYYKTDYDIIYYKTQ